MQIIVLHPRLTSAKTLTLTNKHLAAMAALLVALLLMCAALTSYLTLRHAADLKLPFMGDLVVSSAQDGAMIKDKYLIENLAAMAVKLGEMQAQLMRLDALGERVQGLAGIRPEEFNFKQLPGRGGAEPSPAASREFTLGEFQSALDELSKAVEHRSDYMNVVETTLMEDKVKAKLLPTIQPVDVA